VAELNVLKTRCDATNRYCHGKVMM